MKREEVNYLAVGGFVLAMLVGLMLVLAWVTGRTGPTDTYYADFDRVAGLEPGTEVSFEGYRIGRVTEIEPLREAGGTRYRVHMAVRRGWRIPSDSIAHIRAAGLLAAVSVDIQEGRSPERLAPGGRLAGRVDEDMFVALAGAAAEAQRLLADLRESAAALNEVLDATHRRHLRNAIRRLDRSLAEANRLLAESRGLVTDNRRALREASADLQAAMATVVEHIGGIADNLDASSVHLREFTRELRDNPAVLLRGRRAASEGEDAEGD